MRVINASEFKAKCLAILDEVSATGENITILKRGKPVAQVMPPLDTVHKLPQEELFGTVRVHGDLLEPAEPPEVWDAVRGEGL